MASAAARLQRIFVGNLPWTVGHNELRDFFQSYGHVISAKVVFDKDTGCSKGYGFVMFNDTTNVEALKTLEEHNRLFLEGQYLNVQPTTEKFEA